MQVAVRHMRHTTKEAMLKAAPVMGERRLAGFGVPKTTHGPNAAAE